ncbi:MAG: hypothetical protein R2746_07140 [Acidimicrobiales bacterium]
MALAGGVGAAVVVALVGLVGRSVVAVVRRGSGWTVGLAVGLVAFTVGELVLFPTAEEIDPVVWLLAGFTVAVAPGAERAPARRVPAAITPGVGGPRRPRPGRRGVGRRGRPPGAALGGSPWPTMTAPPRWTGPRRHAELRPTVLRYHLLVARARVAAGRVRGAVAADRDALAVSPGDPIASRRSCRT